MKSSLLAAAVAGAGRLVSSLPLITDHLPKVDGITAPAEPPSEYTKEMQRVNEFTESENATHPECHPIIMFYARGTNDYGNLGTIGTLLEPKLRAAFGKDLAIEGIEYEALLIDNFLFWHGGTDPAAIEHTKALVQLAADECPDSKLVVMGYSQGASLVEEAIEGLPSEIRKTNIAAVVMLARPFSKLFDSFREVDGLEDRKLLAVCADIDLICKGWYWFSAAEHLGPYKANSSLDEDVEFISNQLAESGYEKSGETDEEPGNTDETDQTSDNPPRIIKVVVKE